MVYRLNRCASILTNSSTSNCSEYVDHYCQRRCNSSCCRDQCEFINDRTYTILRKICRKIFNDYKRSQCREKYTVFDGGNSINVRIHRSGSRDNESNHKYEKTSKEDNYLIGRYNRKPGKYGDKLDFNADRSKIHAIDDELNYVNNKRRKGKEARDRVKDVTLFGNRNQKWNSKKRSGVENYDYDEDFYKKTEKGKRKSGQGVGKKSNLNGDRDNNRNTIGNSKGEKHHIENVNTNKERSRNISKRGLRDDNESFENYNDGTVNEKRRLTNRGSKRDEIKSRKLIKGEENFKEREMVADGISTAKSRKVKNKYNKNFSDIGSDDKQNVKNGKYRKGNENNKYDVDNTKKIGIKRIIRKSWNYNNNDEIEKTTNRETKKYLKSQGFIKNLRYKVRRGDTVRLNIGGRFNKIKKLQRLIHHKSESIQNRQNKPSRADEVKACDYLRAHMEQRELCQLHCPLRSTQLSPHICIPQTCIPSCCQNTAISCFSETCEC